MILAARFSLLCMLATACCAAGPAAADAQHEQEILDWRAARHERLSSPDGWLTLVGLEWLQPGANPVGSDPSNDVRIPGGPASWGTVYLDDESISFVPAEGSGVTVDGQDVAEAVLAPDTAGTPTVVRSGDLAFHVIERGSFALRIKDRRAPALLAFEEVPAYAIDSSWRIQGRLLRAEAGVTAEIVNVLGQVSESPVYGTFEFEREGKTHRLLALGTEESESLWFLFADRTSGRESYGAGRFLYSEGMPKDGELTVDFNKAYNPPCAFNDYSTCPLPPAQNRLDIHVRAGEKKYH
ncbi:MAG: DUF1684 domain-containing protein [Xanthomonadales bacterium]|jgi:uncharacterized protein (DUF1684 family)|nr:DUF1684 domain-containing protein [Xanthomonadales bacterium]